MLLECRNLSLAYPDSRASVFGRLTFSLHGPGFNAVFGPSGAGKTSLACILAGSLAASEGEVIGGGLSRILSAASSTPAMWSGCRAGRRWSSMWTQSPCRTRPNCGRS